MGGYSYTLDHSASTTPDRSVDSNSTSTSFSSIEDGIWYFHVRAKDGAGNWGPAGHYKLKIDTVPPPISNLQSVTGENWIKWSWDNPEDDFSQVLIYVDGQFTFNTNREYYNSSFSPGTQHTISVLTVDPRGNINQEWVNHTATAGNTVEPEITSYYPSTPLEDTEGSVRKFNITASQMGHVYWLLNGTLIRVDENTNSASYTKKSTVKGNWNISALIINKNGSDMQTWTWNVQSESTTSSGSSGGGGGGGGGGSSPLSTEISCPTNVDSGSDFNLDVVVDYQWSTEVNINAPEGWEVSREGGTNNFTLVPPENAEGNYTVWVNTTSPFETKREEKFVKVESNDQQVSYPAMITQEDTDLPSTTNTTSSPAPTSTQTPAVQQVESRMAGDIIDKIISGLQAFAGSIFKVLVSYI
ncbi:MAG: hypothetical protein R6U44_06300 [Archaeoglobaceae archaeon]